MKFTHAQWLVCIFDWLRFVAYEWHHRRFHQFRYGFSLKKRKFSSYSNGFQWNTSTHWIAIGAIKIGSIKIGQSLFLSQRKRVWVCLCVCVKASSVKDQGAIQSGALETEKRREWESEVRSVAFNQFRATCRHSAQCYGIPDVYCTHYNHRNDDDADDESTNQQQT